MIASTIYKKTFQDNSQIRTEFTMRILASCLIALFFLSGGCSWVGRTAGKASAKIERKADAVQQGYNDGYKEEQKK
jgi:hypothetical protein